MTVLDDGIEIDDKTIFYWLRGHQLQVGHHHFLVVGSQPLPEAWRAQTLTFTSQRDALDRLRPVALDRIAMTNLNAALSEARIAVPAAFGASSAKTLDVAAKALASGRI